MTWVILDKSFKYFLDFSAFFQIFKFNQMLLKQLKDSQRHQRQPKQVELFLQSGERWVWVVNRTIECECVWLSMGGVCVCVVEYECEDAEQVWHPPATYMQYYVRLY